MIEIRTGKINGWEWAVVDESDRHTVVRVDEPHSKREIELCARDAHIPSDINATIITTTMYGDDYELMGVALEVF